MSFSHCSDLAPNPNLVVQLSLIGSIAGRAKTARQPPISPDLLRQFWSANRIIQQRWLSELGSISTDLSVDKERFERIALELFLTEMLTRVWGTNWTIGERELGIRDVERIFTNSLRGLDRVRREVLLLMVQNWHDPLRESITRLDRFRRRCERWTDLLIAGPAAVHGLWDFAVELDRAQDFGLSSLSDFDRGGNPISLLVSAGLRVMFGTPWPSNCCQSDPFAELLSSIMTSLPSEAFSETGRLKPAAEWR